MVDKDLGNIDEKDIEDLKNLISIVKPEYFISKTIYIKSNIWLSILTY
ncbi:hypothetical protein TDSAC_0757 [Thermodesulfobium acidiphilum]|uniref:Uncharacterized protein n=1 Tax=Thermodesulfobium acidiphilum TaxID=1794699 RepID=A0A2R4W0A6_THEAF|nr:hypothetical protein TDSAC_0757 [Thermodesulfobium acidiphilum]